MKIYWGPKKRCDNCEDAFSRGQKVLRCLDLVFCDLECQSRFLHFMRGPGIPAYWHVIYRPVPALLEAILLRSRQLKRIVFPA